MARFVIAPNLSNWLRMRAGIGSSSESDACPASDRHRRRPMEDDALFAEAIARLDAFLHGIDHDSGLRLPASLPTGRNASGPDLDRTVRVFDADPREVARQAVQFGSDLLIEKPLPRWIGGLGPTGHFDSTPSTSIRSTSWVHRAKRRLTVTVNHGFDRSISAFVRAYWKSGTESVHAEASVLGGRPATLEVPEGMEILVEVEPWADHWSVLRRVASTDDRVDLVCPVIDPSGKGFWWRELAGGTDCSGARGRGLRVGIVDTGVGPHLDLEHVLSGGDFGSGVSERHPATVDLRGHGTHVAGLIGARPRSGGAWEGMAPEAELVACRVFGENGTAEQSDIADAVLSLSRQGCHLVNLSLAAPERSRIERQAIRVARDLGTLCIAAAGNGGDDVMYPAAYQEVVGVGAIGRREEWLPMTPSAERMPPAAARADWGDGGVFGAVFSCRGNRIDCVAPGVGVASTTADAVRGIAGTAVMDGTSMSSPIVTGVLAAALSDDRAYLRAPADRRRTSHARRKLGRLLRATALCPSNWGRGMPTLS